MDKRDIQDLIDRLEVIKQRQVELIEEQIELTKKIAEAVLKNDEGNEFQSGQRDRTEVDRENDKAARRSAK